MSRGCYLGKNVKGGLIMGTWNQEDKDPCREDQNHPYLFWDERSTFDNTQNHIFEWQKDGRDTFILYPRFPSIDSSTYFSEEYMVFVKNVVELAAKEKMKVKLYERVLCTTNIDQATKVLQAKEITQWNETICLPIKKNERIVASYLVRKNQDGTIDEDKITCIYPLNTPIIQLQQSIAIIPDVNIQPFFQNKQRNKEAYVCIFLIESSVNKDSNTIDSIDFLHRETVQACILSTLDIYRLSVGAYFGSTITGILLEDIQKIRSEMKEEGKSWTKTFEQILYQENVHMEELLGLFYSIGEKTESVRGKYNQAIRKRTIETYEKPILDWCENNRLKLEKL